MTEAPEHVYTVLCPFGGLGGGALGFLQAHAALLGRRASFRCVGGIDIDPAACRDFEYLTGSRALCADVATLTPDELRAFAGELAPDVVFGSPPCKGHSRLLRKAVSETAKYQAMNGLVLDWLRLVLATWAVPPKLLLLENVPGVEQRGGRWLREVRRLLRAAGYVFHASTHDCGELGGLAQHRRRYLLVARHSRRMPPLLYQPPKMRVRGCGEVLGLLPLPEEPAAGQLHRMPRISWLNWVRLALIPAGGDWRDLPGVVRSDQERRDVFGKYRVERWTDPTGTVSGSGTNGPYGVADPRVDAVAPEAEWHRGVYGVRGWDQPAATVTAQARPSTGAFNVADPRLQGALPPLADNPGRHHNKYAVRAWDQPAHAVIGATRPGSGAPSVADPRLRRPAHAGSYGVLRWDAPSGCVTGSADVDNGRWSVADPRLPDEPGDPVELRTTPDRPPVIVADDGTWHRPLTTLELACLQGLPAQVRGEALALDGQAVARWRERIGNAVPVGAAKAIATQMLVALVQADTETCALGSTEVWVDREAPAWALA